jgi:hypothetical protein
MKLRKPTKTWQKKPGKRNLLRHKSGRYYARAFASGKEVWKLLTPSHYSVARLGYDKTFLLLGGIVVTTVTMAAFCL